MNKITHYFILAFGYLAVLYPLWVSVNAMHWAFNSTLLSNIFPLLGIIAFTLLWLHSISGVFEPFLRENINFDRFVHITATIILWCLMLHPLLLLISFNFDINNIFFYYGVKYIWLGIIGWMLLMTYDIGKALKKRNFFIKNWNNILIISNVGFLLTFFHSLYLGSNLQSGPLRIVWIFYGITAFFSIFYTYGIKPFLPVKDI